jgi:hypothetical protein
MQDEMSVKFLSICRFMVLEKKDEDRVFDELEEIRRHNEFR